MPEKTVFGGHLYDTFIVDFTIIVAFTETQRVTWYFVVRLDSFSQFGRVGFLIVYGIQSRGACLRIKRILFFILYSIRNP